MMNSPYHSSSTESPSVGSMASPDPNVSFLRDDDNFSLNFNNQIINLNNTTATMLESPELVILDQPIEKFRFRYKSEMMGTHGSLASANSTTRRKRHAPTVQLRNFPGSAIIRCSIVTKNEDRRMPHAHHLVKREGNTETDQPYEVEVSAVNNWTATFHGMGIIHTAKKHIKDELIKKLRAEALEKHRQIDHTVQCLSVREETQIKMDAESAQKWMDLNSVSLAFQAYVPNEHGVMCPLTAPVYSHVINNLKSALTGELKICRIDKYVSSCDGNEEVFLLVEKVGKKNIKVKFFEVDEKDNEIWSAYGRFSELDVHHQYAIVFRTPPYKDRNITETKEVFVQLERPTDGDCSEPVRFTYKPTENILGRKRPRMSYSENIDLAEPILPDTTMSKNIFAFESATPSELSAELKKLTVEKCDSAEYLECLKNIDFDQYIYFASSNPYSNGDEFDDELSTDGPRRKGPIADGPHFASNLLREALKHSRNDPEAMRKSLKKILKERTSYGDTPLHSALRHGQREVVKHILSIISSSPEFKEFVDMGNASGKTPLQYAVMLNQPVVVNALLMLGAEPNVCDNHGSYPLHEAVKNPNAWECVSALLKGKADFKVRDDAGWTPLQLAAEAGSLRAIQLLVEAGDDVNSAERSFGRTPLHIAVEGGHVEVVRYFLEKTNVKVNERNLGRNTALHTALVNTGSRAKEIRALLLKHNADPSIPNGHGKIYERELIFDDEHPQETIKIKEEVEEEDDDPLDNETYSEFASENDEIGNLLRGAEKNYSEQEESGTREIKEETKEERGTITEWLDVDQMATLGNILEKNDGWKKLAKKLGCDYLSSSLENSGASPALTILSYADVQGNLTIEKLVDLLQQLKQTEAVTFLQDVTRNQNLNM
ncbi:nuclear factor NF-kappa-B p110 subunit isoform X2 [Chelonus insularis]|nr:nuclear factor NF-kappa-B p110 subunit isoform X2 [Chelonus insularis]